MKDVEVAIVGGGPAGISTALFLSHVAPGLTDRIVVFEKARYPREKYCAGGVGARADKLLGSIGVQVDVPSVWLKALAFRAMGRTTVVRDDDGEPIGRVVRRIEFDDELARIAKRRGVRVLDGTAVGALSLDQRGVELDTARGRYRAKVVVGADGMTSIVRRQLGFTQTRYQAQALEVDTEGVDEDLPRDVLLFDASHRELPGYYWDFPTIVGGREMWCRGVYMLRTPERHPTLEIQELLASELARRGLSLERCRKKRFAERGFEPHLAVSRPRVLLVGEAAGIDPVTGEGIAQAIQYGATAGRYLARKLVERDLGFGDWPAEVRANSIGRDLHVRVRGVDLFYGGPRAQIERFLLDTPEFIQVGMQHFAGKRWSRRAIARALWRGVGYTASYFARGADESEPSSA